MDAIVAVVVGWVVFVITLLASLYIEYRYSPLIPQSSQKSLFHVIFWSLVAVVFSYLVSFIVQTPDFMAAWLSGYVLEFALSVDNLFVFQLLFEECKTPLDQRDKALVWGIGLACAFRLVFFIVGTELFEWTAWLKIPLGFLLLWIAHTTMKAASSPSHSTLHRMTSGLTSPSSRMRVLASEKYDESGAFWVTSDQETSYPRLSMLAVVVMIIGVVDAVFAIDAVAAKMSQSRNLFVNFSSSLFAMMSFRWLYGLIQDLSSSFHLVKFGIGLVLAYVGIELVLSYWIVIPAAVSCWVIVLVLCGSVIASIIVGRMGEGFKISHEPDEEFGAFELDEVKKARVGERVLH
jgi:tellurite resistance protein TerC